MPKNAIYPILKIIIPLCIGLALAEKLVMSDRSLLVLLTSGFFLTLIMFLLSVNVPYQNEYIAGLLIFIDMIILGICLQVHDNRPFYNYSRHGLDSQSTVLRVISSPEERPKTYRILCEIVDSGKSSPNVCLYLRRNSDYLPQYGHVISVHRALQQIEPPSEGDEFDYRRYCFNKNIGYRVFASEDDIIAVDTVPKKNFHVCVMSLRDNLLNILKSYSPDDKSYSVAAALLLGYDEIDEDTRQSFRAAGTIHVLCVSGLHVATVFMLISFLMGLLPGRRFRRFIAPLLSVMLLWIYAAITGFSSSVTRASLMLTLATVGGVTGRRNNVVANICGSALILMIINPNIIFSVGAKMSYAAVSGIVMFRDSLPNTDRYPFPLNRVVELMCVSVSVQLAIAPIILYYFHTFSTYFLFSNIIAVPLATISLYLGMVMLIFSAVPFVGIIAGKVFYLCVSLLTTSAEVIERIPYSLFQGIGFDIIMLILVAVLLTMVKQVTDNGASAKVIKLMLCVSIVILLRGL